MTRLLFAVLVLLAACAPNGRAVSVSNRVTDIDQPERTFQVRASRTRPYEPLSAPVTPSSVAARPAPQRRNVAPRRAVQAQPAVGDGWARLRQCESGGDYQANTGNGYYGAYQADRGTWGGYGGYAVASDAPPAVQDAWALALFARRGTQPWPVCGRFLR